MTASAQGTRTARWTRTEVAQLLLRGRAIFALVLLVIVFTFLLGGDRFLNPTNLEILAKQTAINAILAIGMTFVVLTGGIDLSVGSVVGLTAMIAGLLINEGLTVGPLSVVMYPHTWMVLVISLAAGVLVGAINGLIITRFNVAPFIATLGMLYVTLGLAQVLSDVRPIYFEATQPGFQAFFMNKSIVGIPNIVWVMLGAAAIAWVLLNKTTFGRYTFALGSNEEATRISGVNVDRWKITVYAVEGLFVGLAGIIIASRMNSAQPGLGVGYELDAIAAAVIGGTSLAGGEGSIVGTVIGAFLISTLRIGLSVAGVPDQWKSVITGLVVIGAVWLDILRRRAQA